MNAAQKTALQVLQDGLGNIYVHLLAPSARAISKETEQWVVNQLQICCIIPDCKREYDVQEVLAILDHYLGNSLLPRTGQSLMAEPRRV